MKKFKIQTDGKDACNFLVLNFGIQFKLVNEDLWQIVIAQEIREFLK